jgi:hypothetical protein
MYTVAAFRKGDAMEQEESWDLIIIRQERGTKKETQATVGGFPDRESAVKVAEAVEAQASRGGNLTVTAEGPDGTRISILAQDFRATRVQKFFSGFG